MNDLLRVENLCAGYGAIDVLRDVSFSLQRGEILALLGENGAGKTTLLRAVCGLLPYRGSCLLAGQEARELSDRERSRRVGWLSQRGGVELPLNGLDVVLMGLNPLLGPLQSPTRAQRAHAMETLESLNAAQLAQRDFTELSAGQRQMLLFARALVRDVELLALDEPEAALDLKRRQLAFSRLRERAAAGSGVLMSSHDINSALRWADRLLLLRAGEPPTPIDLREIGIAELEAALRATFGPMELIEHNGHYIAVEADT